MKKYIVYGIVFFLFVRVAVLSEERIFEIYREVERRSKISTPKSYTARIENKKMEEALSEIPQELITGKEKPSVRVMFRRDNGVRIVVENIDSEYSSLFSLYEEYFRFSGISKFQNPSEFLRIIEEKKAVLYDEDEKFAVIQAWDPEKEEKDDNYALFYLDKKNWLIERAIYYLDGNLYMKAENSYKAYGKYYLPDRITLTNLIDNTSDIFLFKDYTFN